MTDYRDDIERYLRGDMTPAEMHALEKKALDDPFLADALDGATGIPPEEFSSDLDALSERVSRKTHTSRTVRWYYQAAAAVLLTGIAALMVLYLSDREKATTPISFNTPSETESTQPPPPVSDTATMRETPADTDADAPQPLREELPVTPEQYVSRDAAKKVEEDSPVKDEEILLDAEDTPAASALAQKRLATEPAAVEMESASGVAPSARAFKAEANTRTVKGQVLDAEDGMPLPGVNVIVPGAARTTVTDLNGHYEINVPVAANTLVFSFVGLNNVEASVPTATEDTATLDVKMGPDISALSEVVVVGYGTENERGFEEIKWEPAEPEGGKRAFRRYLETNMRYPRIARENGIEGKVTVQFTIEPTGTLTDFRVVRGLGYGCDEEVIRLIREGPRWKPTRRNNEPVLGKGKVKLKFVLPGK